MSTFQFTFVGTMENTDIQLPRANYPDNPLHGVKLKEVLTYLVEQYDWEGLGALIDINCFTTRPSMKSSLRFLRKTPWARIKVEQLYLDTIEKHPPLADKAT